MFQIHFGFDRNGRPRNRYYGTLDEASKAASLHFERTGIVVSIVAVDYSPQLLHSWRNE